MMILPILIAFSHISFAFPALVMNKISSLFTINWFYTKFQAKKPEFPTNQIQN